MSKVRLSLDVSPEMNAQIEGLMSTLGCTKAVAGTTLVMSSLSPLVIEAAQTCAAQILEVEATE